MNMHPRFIEEARVRAETLVAWSERESCDPETGAPGVLRKEWRLRELGDPGVSYDEVHAEFRRVGEYVLDMRYIRRGKDEGWRMFDTCDCIDDLLAAVDDGATALHPRLLELRGQWAESARATAKALEAARQKAADEKAKREREHRCAMAMRRLRENPRQAELITRWDAHVEKVRAEWDMPKYPGPLLSERPEFRETGMVVYQLDTQPGIIKAMKVHLARWEAYVNVGRQEEAS